MLECADAASHSDPTMNMTMSIKKRHGEEESTSPECRSTSTPFLTTLAYCIHEQCLTNVSNPIRASLETYWYAQATGDPAVTPMWGYQESYDKINGTPMAKYDEEAMSMNMTMLVDKTSWQAQKQSMEQFEWQETLNSRYA